MSEKLQPLFNSAICAISGQSIYWGEPMVAIFLTKNVEGAVQKAGIPYTNGSEDLFKMIGLPVVIKVDLLNNNFVIQEKLPILLTLVNKMTNTNYQSLEEIFKDSLDFKNISEVRNKIKIALLHQDIYQDLLNMASNQNFKKETIINLCNTLKKKGFALKENMEFINLLELVDNNIFVNGKETEERIETKWLLKDFDKEKEITNICMNKLVVDIQNHGFDSLQNYFFLLQEKKDFVSGMSQVNKLLIPSLISNEQFKDEIAFDYEEINWQKSLLEHIYEGNEYFLNNSGTLQDKKAIKKIQKTMQAYIEQIILSGDLNKPSKNKVIL